MNRIRTITVTFEKRISDGHYGSELASVQLEAEAQPDDDLEELKLQLAAQARELVTAQLGVSSSPYIRQGLGAPMALPPRLLPEPDQADGLLPPPLAGDLEDLPF